MGMSFNLWLFFGIVAFAASLGCQLFPNNSLSQSGACTTYYDQIVTNAGGNLYTALFAILGAAGLVGIASLIIFGTVSFPNPYTTFGGITLLFLSMVVIPSNLFTLFLGNDASIAPITGFLSSIFYLAWIYGAVAFLKGDL